MNFGELQTALGRLLRHGTKRYPLDERKMHLNHAIRTLQEEFDSQWNQDLQNWDTVADQGEYPIDTYFADPIPIFSHPYHVYYLNSDDEEVVVNQLTYEELSRAYPEGTDGGDPTDFAIYAREVRLRPVPDSVVTLYWAFQNYTRELTDDSDTNLWTQNAETLVLYRAAEYACVHLLEDERVPFFQGLSEREVLRLSVNDGMRDTARRPESQEPG